MEEAYLSVLFPELMKGFGRNLELPYALKLSY
jgi:hypothetical protein